MAQGAGSDDKASKVTDIRISKVVLSKEISWETARKRDALFVEMMRNRVELHASLSLENARWRSSHRASAELWSEFCADLRRYLDGNNVGLFALNHEAFYTLNGSKCTINDGGTISGESDGLRGWLVIYFEDAGDYARFLKDRAVIFKLSSY